MNTANQKLDRAIVKLDALRERLAELPNTKREARLLQQYFAICKRSGLKRRVVIDLSGPQA